jgi:hypothetical protein
MVGLLKKKETLSHGSHMKMADSQVLQISGDRSTHKISNPLRTEAFWEKKSENTFSPKWVNHKTNGTIRKCSSRAFRGGSRIFGTSEQRLKKCTHGGGAAPDSD